MAKKVAVSHGVRHQLMTPPPTAGKQATAGLLATARIPAATGTPALSKGHQQQQDLCGKSKKLAGKAARNMAVKCGSDKKKFGGLERSPSGRGFC